ncbi:MAG: type III pantothenate kinase [Muribaculaceae bacterium]|nr:type III pantothenate kinase [Muribaculaceae bacterium]
MRKANPLHLLTIDQGNSSAKVTVWDDGREVETHRIYSMSIEELIPMLESTEIDSCAYCSVGHTDAKFLETLRRMLDGRLLVLTPLTPVPIRIVYGTRSTLGNDRVAAAVGAARLFPGEGSLVVDAGTAVTIDVVDNEGTFLGGNIAPGVRLRFSSLHEATSQLPMVDSPGEVARFGHDTVSAIRSGVVGGMVSEIADAYAYAVEKYGCRHIVLTGNDAPQLLPLLEERGLPVAVQPNLVGLGLLCIFRYNLNNI